MKREINRQNNGAMNASGNETGKLVWVTLIDTHCINLHFSLDSANTSKELNIWNKIYS